MKSRPGLSIVSSISSSYHLAFRKHLSIIFLTIYFSAYYFPYLGTMQPFLHLLSRNYATNIYCLGTMQPYFFLARILCNPLRLPFLFGYYATQPFYIGSGTMQPTITFYFVLCNPTTHLLYYEAIIRDHDQVYPKVGLMHDHTTSREKA